MARRSRVDTHPVAARADHKERGVSRLEAFSDGVFAIAITLLALDLKVPNLKPAEPSALSAALLEGWPTYLTFVLSFATILIMWVYHHRLFESVVKAESALLFANGFHLLLVTAVPFPTALVGAYLTTPAASVACAAYAGFFALIDLAYNALWWAVWRQQPALKSAGSRLSTSLIVSLLGFPCYVIAMVVAFWIPALTLLICGALWIVWVVTAPSSPPKPT
jgi:uncharacterized membrane protein